MALKRIALRDFVIVQTLELDLHSGFTVLTGETGAGKSILIDALQLALGARADAGQIRDGAEKTEVCAEFDCPPHLQPWLEEAGFETHESLLLRRTVDTQGKSRAWINGSAATAAQLRAVGGHLLDIHGQHAWQTLNGPEAVRGLLDAYAGVSTQELERLWSQWQAASKALEHARQAQDALQDERERILWQMRELEPLAPGEDEWDELNAQHTRLSHAQDLLECAHTALAALAEEESGALERLNRACSQLQDKQALEPDFANPAELLASGLAQAHEAAHALQSYLRRTELDPQRLAELDERISLWLALARRYKRQPAELPALLRSWQDRLTQLEAAADTAALEKAEAASASAYRDAAQKVSSARAKAAPRLSQAITQAMQKLGMPGGNFEVSLSQRSTPCAQGMDEVAFLVAGHPGTLPRPIAKVASGGELSRISLAIAVTTSELGTVPTLIFDEVDSGVGGAVAETVGRLMQQLGHSRQVLAVTHLPQVAACATHHLVVSKHRHKTGTTSTVSEVRGEQRVAEMARMLGGERLSDTTLAHAREMLAVAQAKEQ